MWHLNYRSVFNSRRNDAVDPRILRNNPNKTTNFKFFFQLHFYCISKQQFRNSWDNLICKLEQHIYLKKKFKFHEILKLSKYPQTFALIFPGDMEKFPLSLSFVQKSIEKYSSSLTSRHYNNFIRVKNRN